MILAGAIVLGFVLLIYAIIFRKSFEDGGRSGPYDESDVRKLHSDLHSKYFELCGNPLVSEREWVEWQKVFAYAERVIREQYPSYIGLISLEELANKKIAEKRLGRQK